MEEKRKAGRPKGSKGKTEAQKQAERLAFRERMDGRSGRPAGKMHGLYKDLRTKLALEPDTMLPHEFLWRIVNGFPIEQHEAVEEVDATGRVHTVYCVKEVYASLEQRVDAAKAAAPFFAPRLAAQLVKQEVDDKSAEFSRVLCDLSDKLRGVSLGGAVVISGGE